MTDTPELATAKDVAWAREQAEEVRGAIMPEGPGDLRYADFALGEEECQRLSRLANSAAAMLASDRAGIEKEAYKRGWNDREDDLIAGVNRIMPPAPDDAERERLAKWADEIATSWESAPTNDAMRGHAANVRALARLARTPAQGVVTEAPRREIAEAWSGFEEGDGDPHDDSLRLKQALHTAGLLEDDHGR